MPRVAEVQNHLAHLFPLIGLDTREVILNGVRVIIGSLEDIHAGFLEFLASIRTVVSEIEVKAIHFLFPDIHGLLGFRIYL